MLSGNRRRRAQRLTVGVIIGALVISLALSLLSAAGAAGLETAAIEARATTTEPRAQAPLDVGATTPAASDRPLVGTSGEPTPVTKTPQGEATQVTDEEHIGGLVAFLVFMLGGVLLLVRGHRRDRRERTSASILS